MADTEPHPQRQSALYIALGIFLGAASLLSIIAGFKTQNELQDFLRNVVTPVLVAAFSFWSADFYHRRDAYKQIQRDVENAAYATNVMLHGVYDIGDKLAEASNKLNENKPAKALIAVSTAVAITSGTLRNAHQSLREWESLSAAAVEKATKKFEADEKKKGRRQEIVVAPPPTATPGGTESPATTQGVERATPGGSADE
jgi:hypothetical protein